MNQFNEELISAYIDDELSADERQDVERALAENAEYRRLYEELSAIHCRLRALPCETCELDASSAVRRRVEAAAGQMPSVKSAPSERIPISPVLAADVAGGDVESQTRTDDPAEAANGSQRNYRTGLVAALLAIAATVVVVLAVAPRDSQVVQAPGERPLGEDVARDNKRLSTDESLAEEAGEATEARLFSESEPDRGEANRAHAGRVASQLGPRSRSGTNSSASTDSELAPPAPAARPADFDFAAPSSEARLAESPARLPAQDTLSRLGVADSGEADLPEPDLIVYVNISGDDAEVVDLALNQQQLYDVRQESPRAMRRQQAIPADRTAGASPLRREAQTLKKVLGQRGLAYPVLEDRVHVTATAEQIAATLQSLEPTAGLTIDIHENSDRASVGELAEQLRAQVRVPQAQRALGLALPLQDKVAGAQAKAEQLDGTEVQTSEKADLRRQRYFAPEPSAARPPANAAAVGDEVGKTLGQADTKRDLARDKASELQSGVRSRSFAPRPKERDAASPADAVSAPAALAAGETEPSAGRANRFGTAELARKSAVQSPEALINVMFVINQLEPGAAAGPEPAAAAASAPE